MSDDNFWQLVFNQSRANGAEYFGEHLPSNTWDWPKNTFLQRRLRELRKKRPGHPANIVRANFNSLSSLGNNQLRFRPKQPTWLQAVRSAASVEEH